MAKELFACAPIVLSIVLGVSRPTCAASPPEIAATLEFDTRILDPEVGARIEAQLADQLAPGLAGVGYVVTSHGVTSPVIVRIRVIAFDADARDYEVEVQLLRPGAEPIGGTVVCNACSESRLVGRVVDDAPGLLERREETPEVEPIEPEPLVEPTSARRKVWPIGPMGISGAGLGVMGIVVASVGVQRLHKNEVERFSPNHSSTTIDNYQPAGVTATVLGAVILTTGAALAAVDLKRRWSAARHYAVHVSPVYVGFQIEHRF